MAPYSLFVLKVPVNTNQPTLWRHDKKIIALASESIQVSFHWANFLYVLMYFNLASCQLVFIVAVASEIRQENYSNTGMCSTDAPYTVKNSNRIKCASECLKLATCEDFNYDSDMKECALFLHKPLFYDLIPGCSGFKASPLIYLLPPLTGYVFVSLCVCVLARLI